METYVDPDEHDEHGGMSEEAIKEHEEVTKVKNVNFIQLGRHKIEAWYFSPYPAEYHPSGFIDTVRVVARHLFPCGRRAHAVVAAVLLRVLPQVLQA